MRSAICVCVSFWALSCCSAVAQPAVAQTGGPPFIPGGQAFHPSALQPNTFQPTAFHETAGTFDFAPAEQAPAIPPVGNAACACCNCWPCECPQQPAPCLECPHVSTLQPYWNVNIFGALQANMLYNTARPVAPGIPMFLAPGVNQPENTLDIFARSSSIGALLTGPEIGQFRTSGMVMALFYSEALIVDRYGFLPIQLWGDLRNEEWRFAAGLQFNVFAPNLPTMLTFSALIASGNPGNNFPGQFRIERFIQTGYDSQWTIQMALSDPVATEVASSSPLAQFITGAPALQLTEDNGWPNLEGRVAWSVGELKQEGLEAKRALELGVSMVGGQLRTAIPTRPNVIANTFGLAADFRWRINDRWGVVGEAFTGQTLGFLNAGVLQTVNASFNAIRSSGAWGEVYYYITPCLHTHWGGGVDNPIDRDLSLGQITYNETAFANLIWDITRQLRVGVELTWRETDYIVLPDNEGAGIHTQVQWAF